MHPPEEALERMNLGRSLEEDDYHKKIENVKARMMATGSSLAEDAVSPPSNVRT
jgi:gluconate kinase